MGGERRVALGQFFSQRFGYGVHALAYMAKKPAGAITTVPELSGWLRSVWPSTSHTYLSNVIQRMARGGILRSHRGISGGYSLARPADQITLRDVVELLEGVDIDRCALSLESECPAGGHCSIQRKLRRMELEYLKLLASMSIEALSKDVTITRIKPPAKEASAK
jgi:Rrf2 family protein